MGGDTVGHHQASISEMLHLQQHGRHRLTEDDIIWKEEAANDGDSCGVLLYPDLYKEFCAIFDEESIDKDFLRFS